MNTNDSRQISNPGHQGTDDTCDSKCFITYGTLLKTKNAILNNPRRTLYKARRYEPADGEIPEALDVLPHAFQRQLRRLQKKETILQMPECSNGCFCNDMVLGPGRLKKETRTIGALIKRSVESGYIKPDPDNLHQDEQVKSGELQLLDAHLKPLVLNPDVDIIGEAALLCCGTYDGYLSYNIERRYLYEADVEAEWKIVSGQGACTTNSRLI